MAANKFVIVSPSEIACYKEGTERTVLQAVAPSSMRVKVLGWSIAFDGISVTAEPIRVELVRQSTAGTGSSTTGSSLSDAPETVQTAGMYNATTEPAKGAILDTFQIHPQAGLDVRYEEGECPVIPASGYMGIVVNSASVVNCSVKMICEE